MASWNIEPLCNFKVGSGTFWGWFSKLGRVFFLHNSVFLTNPARIYPPIPRIWHIRTERGREGKNKRVKGALDIHPYFSILAHSHLFLSHFISLRKRDGEKFRGRIRTSAFFCRLPWHKVELPCDVLIHYLEVISSSNLALEYSLEVSQFAFRIFSGMHSQRFEGFEYHFYARATLENREWKISTNKSTWIL